MIKKENEYIAKINDIKSIVDNDFSSLKSVIDSVTVTQTETSITCEGFNSYIVINADVIDHKSKEFLSIRGKSCVYVFKMIDDWSVPIDFDRYMYCAKRKDNKIKIFKKDKILYAGKCYKAITRIHEHYANNQSRTSSLKLGWEERKGLKEKSVMIVFFLNKDLKDYKSIVLPMIEEKLHLDLKPLVGSSRI